MKLSATLALIGISSQMKLETSVDDTLPAPITLAEDQDTNNLLESVDDEDLAEEDDGNLISADDSDDQDLAEQDDDDFDDEDLALAEQDDTDLQPSDDQSLAERTIADRRRRKGETT